MFEFNKVEFEMIIAYIKGEASAGTLAHACLLKTGKRKKMYDLYPLNIKVPFLICFFSTTFMLY